MPVVTHFWQLVHELSADEQKRLIFFVTGSDRAPILGLGHLGLTLQHGGRNTNVLPSSHT